VPDGVEAAVDRVEAADRDPVLDVVCARSQGEELMRSDQRVLPAATAAIALSITLAIT